MNMCELIVKKKRGGRLNEKEIDWIVQGYTAGEIPDYQMSAMLMAICFTGMDEEETKNLTLSMAKSGDLMDLSAIHGKKIDKHSTGGVGDKTTLVIGPLAASSGSSCRKDVRQRTGTYGRYDRQTGKFPWLSYQSDTGTVY